MSPVANDVISWSSREMVYVIAIELRFHSNYVANKRMWGGLTLAR